MIYNREVLTTDISSSILTLTEQARTEPALPTLSAAQLQVVTVPSRLESPSASREWGNQFQRTFEVYAAHVLSYYKTIVSHAAICERIMEELRVQSLAVQVALTNLDAHSRSVLETYEKFNAFATKELTKQARLLQSFPRDIEALRQIKVHPALLPADSSDRYISDFIPTEKLVLWAERCQEIHQGLLRDGKDLSRSITEVQEGTIAIRSNSGINLEQLEDAMNEIIQTVEQQSQIRERVMRDQTRVKDKLAEILKPSGFSTSTSTLEALVQLANVYITDYMDTSRRADDMLRDKLGVFVSAKRSQTANLITQLMHISKLQSTIASIPPSLGNLDDALRKRDADFSQLVYVQRIPIAYGALIVEIVRRREYARLLLQKSQQLAEVMSRFRQQEQRRRDTFRSDIAKFVPVIVPGLEDVPPFCEVNALNTRDRLPPFTREHVAEFERLVDQLSIGHESHFLGAEQSTAGAGTSSISSGQETNQDALSKLRTTLTKMTAHMDAMSSEFDRLLEKTFMTERIQRLEEENARLRADMSRVEVQQRSGTPQLAQHPFPRHGTPAGGVGGSVAQGSTATAVSGGASVNPPTSPKLSRKPSKGHSTVPPTHRADTDEQQHILQQQAQQNQRLVKENTELADKTKAYEARIRQLEDILYQNFRASSSADSSISSKDSRHQPAISPVSEQPWKSPEDIQNARSQSLARERELKRDEGRLLSLEQDLQDAYQKLEQAETKIQNQEDIEAELRQKLLVLELQSATLDEAPEEDKSLNTLAAKKRSEELEEQLKGITLKYEHFMKHNEQEKEEQETQNKAYKDRIEELSNQLGLEKEILEGQLEQARRTAEQATERVTELENELAVVNEELQNKVLELEEELENHAAQHEEVTARVKEQERQLESHRAVHSDILVQLKGQEKKAADAQLECQKLEERYAKLHDVHTSLEKDHEALSRTHTDLFKKHADTQKAKDELAQQTETLHKQISDLEAQREAYKVDVNLRLEEAKTMVRRAEEDWKEKSRLLDQMERATKELAKPIQDCLGALGQDNAQVETATLDRVRERLQDIAQGIQTLVSKHLLEQAEMRKTHEDHLAGLRKERETSEDILKLTISELKKTSQEAEGGRAALKDEMEMALTHAKEELQDIKVSLSTLSLDLGIPLSTISSRMDSPELAYPTSSVLLGTSEKREKSGSTVLSLHPIQDTSSSAVASSGNGSSRSSSTTVPLSKDILQTFDFEDLNVAEATTLIKKKLLATEHLLKRWQRECKHLKEKYNKAAAEAHEKIAFRNFKVDDLTLFLPTRNSISKPWAAFNINFPHYFLQMTPTMANQLKNREWIVARITSITEAIVDKRLEAEEEGESSTSLSSTVVSPHNPFGLADGVKYYLLEATSWNGYHGSSHRHSKVSSSGTSGRSSKDSHRASSSLRHTQSQILEHKKTHDHSDISTSPALDAVPVSEATETTSSALSQLPPTGQTSTVVGNRTSVGSTSGSAPITIPYQSAATNALRAISSSVGSTGSGGSGSVSSLVAHHLGGGSGSGSASTMVASSPPRTMIMSSSPHITGVSTVSAMGTTVSVSGGSASGSHPQAHAQSHGHGGTSPSLGSVSMFGSSNVPIHPSRLSMSSNRDDLGQFAVFATDEDQEQDRQKEQQQQQQREALHRTTSSTSTWRDI
ncbi:hypothetical protein BC939DRAFT_128182 [Gamsiella multidivaricata]|uniref:uncharacterized protein n=1 Tax=Gamsiella multidivaricata TaxID=101098 RepID=UPI00221E43AB|nr:uncharacterized protein BC939DRAFT_128182 [Gamsiella multidivaricata]KAI7825342.1 hypothetical protein BC939DRAFT_128182 [Gamsiella multidivaricata]